jgi:hypothetical protein
MMRHIAPRSTRIGYGTPVMARDPASVLAALSSAGRRLGAGAEAGRIAILIEAAAALPAAELAAVVDEAWRTGDNNERCAVLRALPRLPEPARFVELAIGACRTNVVPVFEAIACDHPYAADHFPEPAFNQMVLKALFLGVAIDRIAGLAERTTPELARMAAAYASERRAAGRAVSADTERLARSAP